MYTGGFKYHKIDGENTAGLVYIWFLFSVVNREMNLFQKNCDAFLNIREKVHIEVTYRGIYIINNFVLRRHIFTKNKYMI